MGVKLDFYDIKGIIEALFSSLHLQVSYAPATHPAFHPGKCAAVLCGNPGSSTGRGSPGSSTGQGSPGSSTGQGSPGSSTALGVFGELHPLVQENYDFSAPVVAADFDLEAVLDLFNSSFDLQAVSDFPPVLEDIAVIVDEALPVDRVEALIRQTGGKVLASVRLFDVFRSEQIGPGKKSLAYALIYQSPDSTLTDKDATQIRNRIIKRLEQELGAKLRS
jgi:phenylalanyl-tRNA synthetase beta chain